MPEFAPSESKTAIAPITVSPAGLSSEVEIFLGPDELTKVVTSGRIPFTSTGARQNVHLPITMPAMEGAYHVYIDVYAEGYLVAAYQAIKDVIIKPLGVRTVRAYYKAMARMTPAGRNNGVTYDGKREVDPNWFGGTIEWALASTFVIPVDAAITQIEFDMLYTYGYNRFDYRWTDQKPAEPERTIAEGYVEPPPNTYFHYAIPISS